MWDLTRLRVLEAVVECGSITAAAQRLGYTPSAVSQQLRRLERDVGQPLLQRHARGMTPTDAGQVLAGHARRVARQLDAAKADLDEIAGLRRGQLHLGTFPTVGASFVPIVVRRFQELFPSVALTVHSEREDGLIAMLEDGRVGLSLLWDYEWRRMDPRRLALTPLFEDPTVLIVADDHPLADRESVTMAQLAGERWVVRSDHPVVEVLRRSAVAAGFEPRIAFAANDYLETQAMVSVGLGVALAPQCAVVTKHPRVRILDLAGTASSRRILLAHRHDRVRAPAEVSFQEVMVQVAATYEPGDV